MKLKNINYEIDTKLVRCILQSSPAEGIFLEFEYILQENELENLNVNWWSTEVKELLKLKLKTEIT